MFDVIIIGGGLSGLAAAVQLAKNGAKIALFEQAPRLGGRCYSYIDKKTGDVVDNGQHVLVGAYHNLLHYLDQIGTRQYLKNEPALSLLFHHPEKGRAKFEISSLPRPFHLISGMLKFKLLSFQDRQRLLKVGLELNGWNAKLENKLSTMTVDEWLISLHQSDEARKNLWHPITISIMNELPEKASALLFARALRSTFLRKKSDSAILLPIVGQTKLYASGAENILLNNGVKIFVNSEVDSVEIQNSRAVGILLRDGIIFKAKNIISTIPPHALRKIIPNRERNKKPFNDLEKFAVSPIISVNLWFDMEFMNVDYIGLIGNHLQWLFNRRRIMDEKKSTSYITGVISGAYKYIDIPKEKLLDSALRDIHAVFPDSRKAKLVSSIIIKEKRATFSATNSNEKYRPVPETSIGNFYLAGDWTDTGLPATIEGAVLSGFKAAKLISYKD
jgi:squalene-associated FAD-dependent desaturase